MWSRITLAAVTWLSVGAPASAQVDNGSIKGFVTDATGAQLAGVTIHVTGPSLMLNRTAASDQHGYYRVLDLPPGQYAMEAQLTGFARFERRDLVIHAGLGIQLDFTMKIGDLAEVVEVRGDVPLLETEKAMRTLHLEGDFLRALPLTPGHNWWDASILAPSVLLRHGAADAVETHGAGVSSNVFLLDGIDVSDPQQNTPYGMYLPPDTVEQTTITTSGHNAASRMAFGAQFGVVTRSGGNATHGAASIDLQFRSLNATNVPGGTSADRSIARPAVSLGGPIIRDRLWYFGAYRYVRERHGLARTDDELATLRLFQPGFVPYDTHVRRHESLAKVTFQATAADRLVLSVQHDWMAAANFGSPRWTRERAHTSRAGGPVSGATWRRMIGGRASIEVQTGLRAKSSEAFPQGDGPSVRVYSSVVSSQGRQFGSGPLIVEMGNVPTVVRSPKGQRSNLNGTLRYLPGAWRGNHELTLGLSLLPSTEYANLNVSSNEGFIFEDRVLLDPANSAAGARAFRRLYQSPVALRSDGKASRAAGFFAQDSWRPGPRLVVNAGVRIDRAEAFDTWGDQVQSSWQTGPRLGITYRLTSDGRTIARGGFNRIHDSLNTFYVFSEGSLRKGTRDEYDLDGDGSFETVFTIPAVLERPAPVPRSNHGLASPRLRQPWTDEVTLGVSRQLPFKIIADAMFLQRLYKGRMVAIDTNGIYENRRFLGYRDPTFNQIFEVRNGTDNWFVYRGLELALHKGFSRNLQFLIGYSHAHQWIDGTWDRNDPAGFLQPEAFSNSKGIGSLVRSVNLGQINSLLDPLQSTQYTLRNSGVPPHLLKVNVAYVAPLGLTVGGSYLFQMGQYSGPILTLIPQGNVPHPPTITLANGRRVSNPLATPVRFFYPTRDEGQLQQPSLSVLNLRIGKRFKQGSHTLEGAVEIFNVFNQGDNLFFNVPTLTEGRPAAFVLTETQAPRAGQITARWEF